ncbi:MAG: DUF4115 domain-containing protein [Synergistes sp.]|nr:DUF4115 domain-containing protein [Synergistes sp.]
MAKPNNFNASCDTDEPLHDTASELGQKLSALRKAQGLSISDVNRDTKIQAKYIQFIEDGNFSALPKGPFARSFVKQYCCYLNAEDLWQKYGARSFEQPHTNASADDNAFPAYARREEGFRKKSKFVIYIGIFLSLAAAVYVTFAFRSSIKEDSVSPIEGGTPAIIKEVKEKEAALAEVERLTQKISEDAAKSAATSVDLGWMDGKEPKNTPSQDINQTSDDLHELNADKQTLKIYADRYSWIKASSAGKILFEGTIKSGQEQSFSPTQEAPLRIRYGRSTNVTVSWNGNQENIKCDSAQGITKYYWYDGTVTDTPKK